MQNAVKSFGNKGRLSASILATLVLGAAPAFAKVAVSTLASASLSADTAGGSYTTLSGPALDEGSTQDIGTGTLVLNAPAGFTFDPTATVLATVTRIAGSGSPVTLASTTGTVTTAAITITIKSTDANRTRSRITWSGIRVRATAGTPLATGNLTASGTANIKGLTSSLSFGTLTETGGIATQLAFATQPAGATAGAAFATQPVVVTRDQFGNNSAAGLAATNYVTLSLTSGTGPLQGTATLNIGSSGGKGTATFSGLRIDVAGSKQLTASSSGGLPAIASASFTVNPGAASQLIIVTQPSATAVAGVPFAQQPVIWIEDAFGNLRTADTLVVTAARQAGAGTLSGTTAVAASGGVVSYNNLAHPLATSITISFTSGTLTQAISTPVAVAPGTFNRLQVLLPGEAAAPGTASGKSGAPAAQTVGLPFAVKVAATDANWNSVPASDTVHLSSSDPAAVLPANAGLSAGALNLSVTMNTAGTQTISASDLSNSAILAGASSAFSVSATNSVATNGPVLPVQPNRTINPLATLVVTNTASESGLTNGSGKVVTNTLVFNYTDRNALLAAGWNFIATLPGGIARNTEITNTADGAVISYDQTAHPGVLRIPCDIGDLWGSMNTSRNALFRSLPANWLSLRLALKFAPTIPYQQMHLAFYQDDDNYIQAGLAYNDVLGGEVSTLIWETAGVNFHDWSNLTAVTSITLRLDQDPSNGNVTGFYSLNGTTWNTLGTTTIPLSNTRLLIWAGGSPVNWTNGLPVCDLSRLDMVSSNAVSVPLSYQLVNAPTGASIDSNGIITWTPTSAQAASTNLFTTIATDNRQPPLSATNSFLVFVPAPPSTNWPSLPPQSNVALGTGASLLVTNTATDGRFAVSLFGTNTILFSYTDRTALLAGGWSFLASTATGAARNTEITNTAAGAIVSYDQAAHPGTMRIPCDLGDLWSSINNTRNSIFRTLPTNWLSLKLAMAFAPTLATQQAHLALYQDDDNYEQVGLAYNGGEKATVDVEASGSPSTTAVAGVALTNIVLRLDRTPGTSTVTAYYSADGTTWSALTQFSRALVNPRLGIWVGGSPTAWTTGMATCDLQRLDMVGSNQPVPVSLSYQLVNPPSGALINTSGIITWTPTSAQTPSTNLFTTVVTDNGQPPLSATNSFTVTVGVAGAAMPMLVVAQPRVPVSLSLASANTVQLQFQGQPGQTYQVQWSPAVTGPWQVLDTATADENGAVLLQAPTTAPTAYFRVLAQ